MDAIDSFMIKIYDDINKKYTETAKKPKFIALNKDMFNLLMDDFKNSFAFSELEYSFLNKVKELESEIGRSDLKISVGKLFGLHIILSDFLEEDQYMIF